MNKLYQAMRSVGRLPRLLILLTLSVVVAAVAVGFAVGTDTSEVGSGCLDLQHIQNEPTANVVDASLLPRAGEALSFDWDFKHNRGSTRRSLELNWQEAPLREVDPVNGKRDGLLDVPTEIQRGEYLAVDSGLLRTSDEDAALDAGTFTFYAIAIEDGVQVTLCVSPGGAKPGSYRTAVQFSDPDIDAAPIAVELTIKEGDVRVPIYAVLFGVWLAFVLIALRWEQLRSVGLEPHAPAIGLGVVLAILGVGSTVIRMWEDNPVWGADPLMDPFTLFSAAALGIFGSVSVSEVIDSGVQRSTKKRLAQSTPVEQVVKPGGSVSKAGGGGRS